MRAVEKYAIGRPSERMAKLLRRFAGDPIEQSRQLFRQVAFRVLIGDEDGHGKNYSLMLDDGKVRLAPLYDSLCTLIYPELSGRMAAKIDSQSKLTKVDRDALLTEARAMTLSADDAACTLDALAGAIDDAVNSVDGALLNGWDSSRVLETIRVRLQRLREGKALGDLATARPRRRGRATMSDT
jgi:serine/threonine-protein kinase HipA